MTLICRPRLGPAARNRPFAASLARPAAETDRRVSSATRLSRIRTEKGVRSMKTPAKRLVAVALAACLYGGSNARADFVDWNYNWTPSASEILADTPAMGKITLSNEPAGTATGDTFVVATNIKTVSSQPASNPAVFTDK